MIFKAATLLCFFIVFVATQAANLPSYITACKVKAPDLKQCAIKSGNAAIPHLTNGDKSLGIPKLNPLTIPIVEFSAGAFKLTGKDVIVNGLSNAKLNDVIVDLDKKFIKLVGKCPDVTLDMDYAIGGKIASLPIEGNGKGKLVLGVTSLSYSFHFVEKERKGTKYIDKVGPEEVDFDTTNVTFQLDNLFNGNKALGDNTNKFLNENWQEVLKEIKPAIIEVIRSIIHPVLIPVLKKVPVTEIFPDW